MSIALATFAVIGATCEVIFVHWNTKLALAVAIPTLIAATAWIAGILM